MRWFGRSVVRGRSHFCFVLGEVLKDRRSLQTRQTRQQPDQPAPARPPHAMRMHHPSLHRNSYMYRRATIAELKNRRARDRARDMPLFRSRDVAANQPLSRCLFQKHEFNHIHPPIVCAFRSRYRWAAILACRRITPASALAISRR